MFSYIFYSYNSIVSFQYVNIYLFTCYRSSKDSGPAAGINSLLPLEAKDSGPAAGIYLLLPLEAKESGPAAGIYLLSPLGPLK